MKERYTSDSTGFLLTNIGLLVLFVGLLLAAWNGQIIITVVLSITLAAGGLTKLWSRFSLVGVSYRRVLTNRRVFPGEKITLEMQLFNRKLLPLPWIQIDEEVPLLLAPDAVTAPENLPGFGFISKTAGLLWYSRARWSSTLYCSKRGYFQIGPVRITSGDLFGFHTRSMTEVVADHVIVYPKILSMEQLVVPASYPQGSSRTIKHIFEDPQRIMGIRDYRPDDSIKKIHWKATARNQLLQVKVLESTTTTGAAIFFPIDSFIDCNDDDFEYGISAVAGIARYLLEQGNPVGLFVNTLLADTKMPARVLPSTTSHQMVAMLEALAKITKNSSGSFDQFINKERKILSWGMTMIMVVYAISESFKATISNLKNSGYKVLVYEMNKGGKQSTPSSTIGSKTEMGVTG